MPIANQTECEYKVNCEGRKKENAKNRARKQDSNRSLLVDSIG